MSKTVKKITDLQNAESFVQANFLQGYKYIDRAGEIVNYFYNNGKPPLFDMNLGRLVIKAPDQATAEVKVSPSDFWGHYNTPDSLDLIEHSFEKYQKDICAILDVDQITRIGWRNYFLFEFAPSEADKREKVLNKFVPNDRFKLSETVFIVEQDGITQKVKLVRAERKVKAPPPAILFDVDCYRDFPSPIKPAEIGKYLKQINKQLHSEDFLSVLNTVLDA